jgi:hypothetical protein
MTTLKFDRLEEIISAQAKRGLDTKKIDNNTYVRKDGNCFVVKLHNTDIIKVHPGNVYELNAGGWQTVTTKSRLCEFTPARIYQKRGVWFLQDETPFFDGIRVDENGNPINVDSAPSNLVERKKRLDRMTSKYIRAFAEDAIQNGLKDPNSGDCLYCQIFLQQQNSQASEDLTHIYSHLEECYFVPSLLFRAIKERGYANPAFIWSLIKRDAENGRAETLKQCLRHFFSKRKSQLVNFIEL